MSGETTMWVPPPLRELPCIRLLIGVVVLVGCTPLWIFLLIQFMGGLEWAQRHYYQWTFPWRQPALEALHGIYQEDSRRWPEEASCYFYTEQGKYWLGYRKKCRAARTDGWAPLFNRLLREAGVQRMVSLNPDWIALETSGLYFYVKSLAGEVHCGALQNTKPDHVAPNTCSELDRGWLLVTGR
ncbi:MAG: hypothetical protein HQL56_15525 [Magnetococcales bacterium]|nr:hypothetical protein [Magnetococcales bacterium]